MHDFISMAVEWRFKAGCMRV